MGEPLFSSPGRWLHPLFELEAFLADNRAERGGPALGDLYLRDRVIGTAAAFLILRLGLREVETDVASRRAMELLRGGGVKVETRTLVEAIGCATERLLLDETDPDAAYKMLCERRARASAR